MEHKSANESDLDLGMDEVSAEPSISDLCPYRVSVTVERAENLMAANHDGLSSDPYVKLSSNKKVIGTTKVIKKRLSPTWNTIFEFSVISLRCSLIFEIYDENSSRDDELMGSVELDLSANERGANSAEGLKLKANVRHPLMGDQGFLFVCIKIDVSFEPYHTLLNIKYIILFFKLSILSRKIYLNYSELYPHHPI